jgi:DNA gyrase subunit A
LEAVRAEIARLTAILDDTALLMEVIEGELIAVRTQYADGRRTGIIDASSDFALEDLIPVEDMVVTVSHEGYVKRVPLSEYRTQRRGGRGKSGMATKDTDFVQDLFVASTHSTMLFFTTFGRVFSRRVFNLPKGSRTARGKPIINLLPIEAEEKLATVIPIEEFTEGHDLFFATANGVVKKTRLQAYGNIRTTGIIGIGLREGDQLIDVTITNGNCDVMLATRNGMSIRFREEQVRTMGRGAAGVRGIRLMDDDQVVGCITFDRDEVDGTSQYLLTSTEHGYGKRTPLDAYLRGGETVKRGGKGLIDIITDDRNGPVVGILKVEDESDEYLMVTNQGVIIRARTDAIRAQGRNTKGVKLINLDGEAKVVSIALNKAGEEDDEEGLVEGEDGAVDGGAETSED